MRRLTLCFAIGIALAAPAQALAGSTSIFFYPWYSTPGVDGFYKHWDRAGHVPPADLASSFYPARGVYSSSDAAVLRAQMREISGAGIAEVVSSWWGVGSPEDRRLPAVIEAAKAEGLQVAAQLEPYDEGRTPTSVAADITRLRELGITRIYVYRPFDIDPVTWLTLTSNAGGVQFFGQTANVPWAAAAGFDGIYTYDIVSFGGKTFAKLCARARAARLLCAPSVGPGYNALRANGDATVLPRRDGATYDAMWQAAVRSGADLVTITSYNEWHEGTQIEPALSSSLPRSLVSKPVQPSYETYRGAYRLYGRAASRAYLTRTAFWTRVYRSIHAPNKARTNRLQNLEFHGRESARGGERTPREQSGRTPPDESRVPRGPPARCHALELAFCDEAVYALPRSARDGRGLGGETAGACRASLHPCWSRLSKGQPCSSACVGRHIRHRDVRKLLMLLKEDQHETDLPEWQHGFGDQTSIERGVMFSQAGNLHRAD